MRCGASARARSERNRREYVCARERCIADPGPPRPRLWRSRDCGGPASAAQRGSTSVLSRKAFGRAAPRAGHEALVGAELQLIWPWQDRKNGFSWLKAGTFALMFVPALWLA